MSGSIHIPILVGPIIEALIEPLRRLPPVAPACWIVDCTFGGGGHTGALLEALAADPSLSRHRVLALDQDERAIQAGQARFARERAAGALELQRSRFSEADRFFKGREVIGLLADLGFSSDQLEDAERGFSFSREGPLDMRLDPASGVTARDLMLRLTERELATLLHELGEERFSRGIARAIVEARRRGDLPRTTTGLAALVTRAVPPAARHGRIHPATRTFQALRIRVNGEIEELDRLLDHVILGVRPGGRVALFSFHSLEDRKVKLALRERDGPFVPLTKKPIEPGDEEVARNPRARSAKLRIAERRLN